MNLKNYLRTPSSFFGLFLGVLLVLGCKEINTKVSAGDMPQALVPSTKEMNEWPAPDSYAGGLPVYETFEKLEPLFRFDNDTTYVVNFWATWCKPCIKELPYFEELHQKKEKVRVVLVSLDFPEQVESKLVPFVQKKQLKSKVVVLLDGKYDTWIDKVSPDWSGAIPATYIYKGGQHHLIALPFENTQELTDVIKPFL